MPIIDFRIKNILDSMFSPSANVNLNPNTIPPAAVSSPQQEQPTYQAQDQLKNMLLTMPQRESYQPSPMRQILGAIAGLGTGGPAEYSGGAALGYKSNIPAEMQVQDKINYAPYYQELGDWSVGMKPLGELADAEAQRNTNIRTTQNQRAVNDRLLGSAEETERKNRAKEEDADLERERKERMDKARIFALQHQDMKPVIDSNGELIYVDPKDPARQVKTGIDTGKMNDMEKLEFGRGTALESIAARGAESRETETQTHEHDLEEIAARGKEDRATKKIPSSSTVSGKSTSATQKKQELINKANEMISRDPDVEKYLNIDNTGVKVKPSSWRLDDKKRMAIYNELFGQTEEEKAPKAPAGWKYVKKSNGGWTAVRDN